MAYTVPKYVQSQLRDLRKQIDGMNHQSQASTTQLNWSEKSARVERSAVDAAFFFKTYLPKYFYNEPAPYHKELPVLFSNSNFNIPLVILAPRGGAKSTFLFGETLRLLVTGQQKFIVRVENSERIANKEIFKIRTEIETNRLLYEDFGNLKGSPWTASELYFSNGTMLWGRGQRQPVRGVTYKQWRPTGIIYNDVETQKQVMNQKLTDEIYDALFTEALPALNPVTAGGGFLAIVGTLLGERSMLAQLIDSEITPNARIIYYKAIRGDDVLVNLLLTKVSQDAHAIAEFSRQYEGYPPEEVAIGRRKFFSQRADYVALLEQVSSFWPDRFPVEDLLIMASTQGTLKFRQEFQHEPINATQHGPFPREWFTRPQNTFHVEDIPHEGLVRAIFLDPSYKDTPTSDDKAFVIGFFDTHHGVGYILRVIAGKFSYHDMIDHAFALSQEYLLDDCVYHGHRFEKSCFIDSIFAYENNAAQGWLEDIFNETSKRTGIYLPKLTGVTHTVNKIIRISQLSLYVERGKLKFNLSDDEQLKTIEELCDIGNKSIPDNRADALEGFWSVVEKIKSNIIMASKDLGLYEVTQHKRGLRQPIYSQKDYSRYVPYGTSVY